MWTAVPCGQHFYPVAPVSILGSLNTFLEKIVHSKVLDAAEIVNIALLLELSAQGSYIVDPTHPALSVLQDRATKKR